MHVQHTRRTALQLLAAGTLAVPFTSDAARQPRNRIDPVGLQLYTVRGPLKDAFDEALRRTLDDYRRVADVLNAAADSARKADVRIAYHNHAFEFALLENRLPYDVLLQHAEEQVSFELDAPADPFASINASYRYLREPRRSTRSGSHTGLWVDRGTRCLRPSAKIRWRRS